MKNIPMILILLLGICLPVNSVELISLESHRWILVTYSKEDTNNKQDLAIYEMIFLCDNAYLKLTEQIYINGRKADENIKYYASKFSIEKDIIIIGEIKLYYKTDYLEWDIEGMKLRFKAVKLQTNFNDMI
jgi:hypothetical protein